MPPKAKKETVEKATDTMSSWKTAEMKKMTNSTAKRLWPRARSGRYTCWMNQKCTLRFHVFQNVPWRRERTQNPPKKVSRAGKAGGDAHDDAHHSGAVPPVLVEEAIVKAEQLGEDVEVQVEEGVEAQDPHEQIRHGQLQNTLRQV